MKKQKEIWKDVPGFIGYYQVSNLGRLKSLDRMSNNSGGKGKILWKGRLIFGGLNSEGYNVTRLSKNGKYTSTSIHRLVMLTFKGKSKLYVDHINGNPLDNRLVNLRYCTQRENLTFSNVKRKNKTGFVGVKKNRKKYESRIQINKQCKKQINQPILQVIPDIRFGQLMMN